MNIRPGALVYDKASGRYDIRFGLDEYYGGLRACALCRGRISAQGTFPALRYGGFAATRGCTPCAASRLSLHTHKNSTPAVGVCTIFAGFIILSGR